MDIKILFEDDYLLVLEKPSGMVVNRSDTTKGEKTLQDWVEEKFSIFNFKFSINKESDFYNRVGIVHRLDKETSGILLVAKTPEAFLNLQAQFKERKVQKTYIALVHGKIEPKEREINVAVGRLPWNRRRFGVLSGGREAVTKYKVLRNVILRLHAEGSHGILPLRFTQGQNDNLTLLELYPKTGRTHQIRVHLQYIHYPIFADPLYAGRKTSRNDRKLLSRIFLHASKISFLHPARHASQLAGVAGRPAINELISFESPLPKDLNDFLEGMKA